MNVRPAKRKDIDKLSVLFDKYRQFYKQVSDVKTAAMFLRKRMKRGESVIIVTEEDKKITGFMQLYPIFTSVGMQRAWLLNDLFVDEIARNRGAATALLDAARELGIESDSKWIMLQTGADNITAQKLYERNGWKKETDIFYRMDV